MSIVYTPTDSPFPGDGLRDPNWEGLKLEVFGQFTAQQYIPTGREVCISITTPYPYMMDEVPLSDKFVDILRLQFADTPNDTWMHNESEGEIGISEKQAQKVAVFVFNQVSLNLVDKIVIHCFAGASRSRSMAAAISDAMKLPYQFTIQNDIVYNRVYDALINIRGINV